MRTDEQLQQDVEDAIQWEPTLNAAEIGVAVHHGIVTLSGTVDTYFKKLEAEHAAKDVLGVKAVVEKIDVHYSNSSTKSDEEIAAQALKALADDWSVPDSKIKLKVEKGFIYLDGIVNWNFQKRAAKRAVQDIQGIKGVIDNLKIKAEVHDALEKSLIKKALKRHWAINSDNIDVAVSGTTVTLTGKVSSIYEKEEAGKIAWKTPGVWMVINNLEVKYDYSYS